MIEELRRLIDPATDAVLVAWGRCMKGGEVGTGYSDHSTGFMTGGISCYDDLVDQVDKQVAAVAMACVYGFKGAGGLSMTHRMTLVAIYAGGRWVGSGDRQLEALEAANAFERKARAAGIL